MTTTGTRAIVQAESSAARLKCAMQWSAAVALYLVAVRLVFTPLHEAGWAQPLLAALNAVGFVLGFPGYALAGAVNRRAVEHLGAGQFGFAVAADFVLYALGLLAIRRCRTLARRRQDQPPSLARRALFKKTADLAAGGLLGGGFGYSLLLEPAELHVTCRILPLRGLPLSLNGLRLVQVSDLHHGPWLSIARVREVVDRVNALQADVILLTGDYVYESPAYIEPAIAELAELRAKIGVVGVLGNHDWWDAGRPMKEAFARHRLRLIDNNRVFVTPDHKLSSRATKGLCLAGVGDLWEDLPSYKQALAGVPEEMPRLLLAHNPDCAEDPNLLAHPYRIDLMISGHTHGGQVRIPGLGTPILPSRYGHKYAAGLVQGPVCPVLISRGIGLSGLPVRFGVPPEIVVLELTEQHASTR